MRCGGQPTHGISSRYVTFLEGVRKACEGKARVLYAEGSHLYKDRVQNLGMPTTVWRSAMGRRGSGRGDRLSRPGRYLEGEQGDTGNEYSSGDKNTLELPPCQVRLLETLRKTGKPLVLVLASGSSIRVEDGNAILWAGYPGTGRRRRAGRDSLRQDRAFRQTGGDLLQGSVRPAEFTDYHMEGRTYRYYEGTPLYPSATD